MAKAKAKEAAVSHLGSVLKDADKSGVPLKHIVYCLNNEAKALNSLNRAALPARWSSFLGYAAAFTLFKLVPCIMIGLLLQALILQLLNRSSCVFPAPLLLCEMFIQPLANCSVCEGIAEAPRLVNISRKEFALYHAHSSRPIVVIGAALKWPAMETFSYDYFRNLYNSYPDAINIDTSTGQFFSYSSNIRNLKELFELPSERAAMTVDKWYVGW